MKLLIVGASSFIGFRFFRYLKEKKIYDVVGTYFKNKKDESFLKCDITNSKDVENVLKAVEPDVLLWLAGSKNLKECEASISFALSINTNPVLKCVDYLKKSNRKIHFIFFSTDYVFDGEKGNFTVTDMPNPKTNYGLSNLLAEKCITHSKINYSIIRTSAVMGKGGTFFDWLVDRLKRNEQVEMFSDIYFTPTLINFLIENIINIINNNLYGTFHICGSERLSRYELALILKSTSDKFKAQVVPANGTNNMKYFQKDLSMVQSKIVINNKTLKEYLKEEVLDD
jgi:dTDP-4-dehydrorhamnose reductase